MVTNKDLCTLPGGILTQLWDEFGEAMIQDFQLAPKNFGKLFGSSGEESGTHVHMVLRVGWELLTSTVSIIQQWKEYFDDLLNPTKTHSKEEAKLKDFGLGSLITRVGVARAVKQLRCGSSL